MAERVNFIAPCSGCSKPVVWTATKDPVTNSARETPALRITCVSCDARGLRP